VSATWDPAVYLQFDDERTRPFRDLLARVDADPATIVDLGCGPGHLTQLLHQRWPESSVIGVDSSMQMIERARATPSSGSVRYEQADLRHWRAAQAVDLLVSAATLQWVPGHLQLLPSLAEQVASGGTMAFTVPGNFDAPSHVLLRELAGREPYARWTTDVSKPAAHDATTYLDALLRLGWRVDAWETTYVHLLQGPDPVLRWISGTGARPVLQALPDDVRQRFVTEYAAALRTAYPERAYGTLLQFRRVFVVARRQS
jgi:trans-aconitate 2-methyltransferase